MTLKKLSLILVILFCIVLILYVLKKNPVEENPVVNTDEPPVFVWQYQEAKTLNGDGNPETDIFLEVKYPNGKIQTKLIDTTPGSCNDLPNLEPDTLLNTTNIQCYSAGLGYRYKIIKGENSYLVERQTFEEGLPDYNPPSYKYEVVDEFSF